MKRVRHLAIVLATGIAASGAYLSAQQPPPKREIGKIYAESCANCHGPALQGAQFGSLIDSDWKFGSDDASVRKAFARGTRPGMPPMGGAAPDYEVRALVISSQVGAKATREKAALVKPAANGGDERKAPPSSSRPSSRASPRRGASSSCPTGGCSSPKRPARSALSRRASSAGSGEGHSGGVGKGQGGLLDVAVHPNYARNGWIYLSYSDPARTTRR